MTAALVVVGVDARSVASRVIDAASGGAGWTHVYVDVSGSDNAMLVNATALSPYLLGELVVDYTPMRGVHWRRESDYDGRARARVELEGELGEHVACCVAAKVGQPFNVVSMALDVDDGTCCSGLVVHCLPAALREDMRRMERRRRIVTPADVARYFGLRRDGDVALVRRAGRRNPWARYSG